MPPTQSTPGPPTSPAPTLAAALTRVGLGFVLLVALALALIWLGG